MENGKFQKEMHEKIRRKYKWIKLN